MIRVLRIATVGIKFHFVFCLFFSRHFYTATREIWRRNPNSNRKSEVFTYRWRLRCSPPCSRPAGTFQTAPSSSPCSCTWRRCTAKLERGRSSVSSTFSRRLCPRRTSTCETQTKLKSGNFWKIASATDPSHPTRIEEADPQYNNSRPYRFAAVATHDVDLYIDIYIGLHIVRYIVHPVQTSYTHRWNSNSPAVFHIERLVHAAGDFDTQVLVGRVFGNFHFVPLGKLGGENEEQNQEINNKIVRRSSGKLEREIPWKPAE